MTTDKTIPKKIGKYEVIKEVERGGMGIVYLARDPLP
jgi:ribosomal protein L7Ae-like RNA K-turn-binding protein